MNSHVDFNLRRKQNGKSNCCVWTGFGTFRRRYCHRAKHHQDL